MTAHFFFSLLDVFFMSAQQITQHLHIFFLLSAQLMYSVGFAFRINFYDLGCCMCLVLCAPSFFLGFLFSHSGNVLNRGVEGEFPADSYVCILFAIAEQYIRRLG